MALTDVEKLAISKTAFHRKIDNISTWTQFKSMVAGITVAQLKTFIKNNIDNESTEHSDASTTHTNLSTDLTALGVEVNAIT